MTAGLALRIDGPADAPPIVLLHAIATSSALWAPQVAAWSARFRVIRLDLPGHGASPPLPGDPRLPDYARAVVETLDALNIDRVGIVGLSFGAMIGLRLAADWPDRVRAAALCNFAAVTPPPLREMWAGRIAAVAEGGMEGQVAPTLVRWLTPDFAAAAPLTRDWVASMIRATPAAGFSAAAAAIAALDESGSLARIACPTLLMAGEHDAAVPPEAMRATAERVPGARIALIEAAHLANVERPVDFTETVGAFLMETVA